MRPSERQTAITDMVRQQSRVSVESLAHRFAASPETIRRDLAILARKGKVQKVHGGAIFPRTAGEGPFADRMRQNVMAKRRIAEIAVTLVSPGQTVMIDTGSTSLILAEELVGVDNLTVVTNSAEIARVISSANYTSQVFLLGGGYHADNRQTFGAIAIDQLSRFRADVAMLTIGALDADGGVMDYNPNEADMARAMMQRSGEVMLLVDSSKFGKLATFTVTGFDAVDKLVCERPPDGILSDALARASVKIYC